MITICKACHDTEQLRSNPGLKLANAFGVFVYIFQPVAGLELANALAYSFTYFKLRHSSKTSLLPQTGTRVVHPIRIRRPRSSPVVRSSTISRIPDFPDRYYHAPARC